MAYLGRRGASAPLTSADIPAGSVSAVKVASDVATQAELDAQRTNSSITTLGTVTAGVLEDAVTYRNINQDLGTTDSPAFDWPYYSGKLTADNNVNASILLWTNIIDSDSAMSSGIYTTPKAGKYEIQFALHGATTTAGSSHIGGNLYIDSVAVGGTGAVGYPASNMRVSGGIIQIQSIAESKPIKIISYLGPSGTIYGDSTYLTIKYLGV